MVYRIDMFEERCLVQLLRVGTYIEVGYAYRGIARFSRKIEFISTGEWFYPKDLYMICLLIICISFMKVMFILSYCMESRDCMARYYWHIDICAWDWDVALIV